MILDIDEQFSITTTSTLTGFYGCPSLTASASEMTALTKLTYPSGSLLTVYEISTDDSNWVRVSSDGTWINISTSVQVTGDKESGNYLKYTQAMEDAYDERNGIVDRGDGNGVHVGGGHTRGGASTGGERTALTDNDSSLLLTGTTYYNHGSSDSSITSEIYSDAVNNRILSAMKAYGAPPQWTKFVDPRIKNIQIDNFTFDVGRVYGETVVGGATILSLCPGIIEYNSKLSATDDSWLNTITDSVLGGESDVSSDLRDALGESGGSFVKFTPAWDLVFTKKLTKSTEAGYMAYVNFLSKLFVIYMSRQQNFIENTIDTILPNEMLSDRMCPGANTTYKDLDWTDIDGTDSIAFYVDSKTDTNFKYVNFFAVGQNNIREEFETNTRSTTIEDTINGNLSGVLKDVAFLTGGVLGTGLVEDDISQLLKTASEGMSTGLIGNLFNGGAEMLKGGKIMFPQIIDDCTFGKSTTFTCRFISTDGNPEAVFLNTMAGYTHLLPFVLPRQVESAVDMYSYPFLCKAFAKGIFNCPTGVLTHLSITRAGQDDTMWTIDGLPLEIEVQFEIVPLLSKMSMSHGENPKSVVYALKNTGLQEYIGTLTGVDLRLGETDLKIQTFAALSKGFLMNIPERVGQWLYSATGIRDGIRNAANILSGINASF